MSIVKPILGLILIIVGLAFGAFVGIYLMLVGGIIQIVESVSADPIEAHGVAWGVVRIIFASAAGGLAAAVAAIPGAAMLGYGDR